MNVSRKGVPQSYNSCAVLLKPIHYSIGKHRNIYSKLFHKQSRGLARQYLEFVVAVHPAFILSDQQTSSVVEPHNHKPQRVRSGLGESYGVVPRRSVHRLGKELSSHALIERAIIILCCILREVQLFIRARGGAVG